MIASAMEAAGVHVATLAIHVAQAADLAIVDHVDLATVDHADKHQTVAYAAQPHLAHLVAQVIHLAAHQHKANHAHLDAQLSAQLAAHKVWMARR